MNERSSGGFRIPPAQPPRPADPEALFHGLRRARHVQFIWSQQSDLLRSYHEHFLGATDVALELPTGTGKTLVGLLLAEWRRLFFRERALYLCPTRQLCHQVGRQTQEYGIRAHVLVGPGDEFPPDAFADYLAGDAVAITTYAHLFNYRPKFQDPGTLVLDDAHGAEGYASSMWTVSLGRWEHAELFDALLNVLSPAIPIDVLARLRGNQYDPRLVSAVPFQRFWELVQQLRDLFNSREEAGTLPLGVLFPWLMIRDHLDACQVYYSVGEIAIRPFIPPTSTHPPFASARQRIYMSATLGEGGELERIFGIPQIARIPVPRGWDQQGSGRRLVLFPNRSLRSEQVDELRARAIESRGRALVMSPSHPISERLRTQFGVALPNHRVLSASDVERTLTSFTGQERAILVLAGRYDGIDLPDDTCRLLIVHALPAGITLQERFLNERLGAVALLRDRIRTRLAQAIGRCTRNANDFAIALLEGDHILDFCTNPDHRRGFHPELQAEMEFGLQNSDRQPSAEAFLEMIEMFMRRGPESEGVEQAIVGMRQDRQRQSGVSTGELQATVEHEIAYVEALWHGAYDRALTAARAVADRLSGRELASYRAWWYYLAGVAAWLMFTTNGQHPHRDIATDFWRRGRDAAPSSWFREMGLSGAAAATQQASDLSLPASRAVEQVTEYLTGVEFVGPRFERETAALVTQLAQTESTPFELGLQQLGTILGWTASRPGEQGAPDSIWSLPHTCLVFEAKSDESPAGPITRTTTQQAAGHAQWVRANLPLPDGTPVIVLLISHRTALARAAAPHADDVYVIPVTTIQGLAESAINALREARSLSGAGMPLLTQSAVVDVFRRTGLLSDDLVRILTGQRLDSLRVE